jgi:predicted O-methyltransferase YrrM
MPIVDEAVERYLSELQPSRDPVLAQMEARAAEERFPIIGPLVGNFCRQLAISIGARDVFEMGSGFGYSTWWFAQAVGPRGRVVHTDGSAQRSAEAKVYLKQSDLSPRVTFEVGDAIATLQKYPGPFDLVFIDIDKQGYPDAFELARSRVRVGGYILVDNTLWSGKVARPPEEHDADTKAIVRFTQAAFAAPELATSIVPLRDGVAVCLKVAEDHRRRR